MKIRDKFIFLLEKINSKIMVKIITVYILIVLIPMNLLFTLLYLNSVSNIREKLIYSIHNSYDQSYSHIYDKLANIKNIALHISYNESFLKLVNSSPESLPMLDQVDLKNEVMKYLNFFDVSNNLVNSSLYINNNFAITGIANNIFSLDSVTSSKWYTYMISSKASGVFVTSEYFSGDNVTDFKKYNPEKFISYFYKTYSSEDYKKLVAIIRLDFYKSSIESILKVANSTPNTTTFIINSAKDILVSSDYDKVKDYSNLLANLSTESISSNEAVWSYYDNKSIYTGIQNIKGTDWYLISCIPDLSSEEKTPFRIFSVLVLLILPILSVIYLYYITHSFINRVKILSDNMNSIYPATAKKASEVTQSRDEITQLYDSYNYLLERIDSLMEEQASTAVKLKNMEISTLQLQMNPHFLHNILEMLLWFIRNNKATEAENAIFTFSRFNKLALNKGSQFHTLKREIDLIEAYIKLSSMLSQADIHLETNIISNELLMINIPKMLLQPFVENSINAGIISAGRKQGIIKITCKYHDSDIILILEDDGKGIDRQVMDELNLGHFEYNQKADRGYGLKNVYDRIKIVYGDKYGFHFERIEPHGTKVTILISGSPNIN